MRKEKKSDPKEELSKVLKDTASNSRFPFVENDLALDIQKNLFKPTKK